jgi:hypothetical protein
VRLGDRWVEFAYVEGEDFDSRCSFVLGYYECTRPAKYGRIPPQRRTGDWGEGWREFGWFIEGKRLPEQPSYRPVTVPSLDTMLKRDTFTQRTIVPLRDRHEFELIRNGVRRSELKPEDIPVLGREPLNEQEVLTIVAAAHHQLGISKILRVRTAFPDMLVRIGRRELHLELEYDARGFWHHWHDLRRGGRRNRRAALLRDLKDKRPVGLLCWVDSERARSRRRPIRNLRVFELRSLLRAHRKIRWT